MFEPFDTIVKIDAVLPNMTHMTNNCLKFKHTCLKSRQVSGYSTTANSLVNFNSPKKCPIYCTKFEQTGKCEKAFTVEIVEESSSVGVGTGFAFFSRQEGKKMNEQTAIELLKAIVEHHQWHGDDCLPMSKEDWLLVGKFIDTVEAVCKQIRD